MSSSSESFRPSSAVRYESTGKLGPAVILLPLVMLLAMPLWATVYAYVDVYCPISGWISLVLVLFFALGISFATAYTAFFFKCRSALFVALIGLASAVLALYCSWVMFEFALLRRQDPPLEVSVWDLARSPGAVWELAKLINEDGWYTIKGTTPKGIILWSFWGIEAVAVLVGGLISFRLLPDRMFCELCNRWCDEIGAPARFAAPADLESLHGLAGGDVRQIEMLQPAQVAGPLDPLVQLVVNRCNLCRNTAGIRISLIERSVNKEGKVEESVSPVGPFVMLSREAYSELETQLATATRPAPAPEDASDEPPAATES